jgi:hypothetical protein
MLMKSEWTKDLTDEQKEYVMNLVITTVKEIREQIALDIEYTYEIWAQLGKAKGRKIKKAFEVSADIARGANEKISNM